MPPATVEIEVRGRIRSVAVERVGSSPDRFRVSWDGVTRVVDARQLDPETLSLVVVDGGAASHQVRCVETDQRGEVEVHVNGAVVRVLVDVVRTRLVSRRGRGGDGGRHVKAPMPGKVVRLLVQPGEEVTAGQGVIVIEAMKMENELTAPRDGRIAEIPVQEGTLVESGRVLVVLE